MGFNARCCLHVSTIELLLCPQRIAQTPGRRLRITLVKIAACQMPDVRETPDTSLSWIERYANRATNEGVRLICFPECFLQGYLVEKAQAARHAICLNSPAFDRVLRRLANTKPMLVFGIIELDGDSLYNTAVVIEHGRLIGSYRKTNLLPGERAFSPGST